MSPEPPADRPHPFPGNRNGNSNGNGKGRASGNGAGNGTGNGQGPVSPVPSAEDHPSRRARSGGVHETADAAVPDPTSRSAPHFVPLSLADFLA